jgi:hypothetical protein
MKILGVSVGTIVFIAALIYIVRKWGGSIPVVKSI